MIKQLKEYRFLLQVLIKRDFTRKYKRTMLGLAWSLLEPLLHLGVMALVFTQFFGRETPHYIVYLCCGRTVFSYFSGTTSQGMHVLISNASIFSKIAVPKWIFLLSKNIASLIDFAMHMVVLFAFVIIDHVPITPKFLFLLYPTVCLVMMNYGVGMILAVLYMKFKDLSYLYSIFTQLLMYMSAIFYNVKSYPIKVQFLFNFNPVYVNITYFRKVILDGAVPSMSHHLLIIGYAMLFIVIGAILYKRNNNKLLYYV